MIATILSSTLLLTLLLSIGLFFFIRASVKDRTEVVRLISGQPQESLFPEVEQYFAERSYRVAGLDAAQNQVTFEGFVRPSWFLAIFLSFLAAVGILCLTLVLSILFPQVGMGFLGLEILSPIAGIFYWQKAGRPEQVSLQFEDVGKEGTQEMQSAIVVKAHRDELSALQQALCLQQERSQ
ncbi:cofactor assembly of complex C subunit B [Aerosakkonema funiforme]|uniref:Cofactor assembly of complex C subunit B n=2 Tax=Oscillatoriophycideae TaxID=1301283 RepID=A0A926ZH45_9CYAN|nr:cofactor assembly of complex C subunit B [Aerosakkonema funiforme]MBD2182244.1 cofactor assembly of complex C subunit B [Aerosakkonema funiforme FACHB-1375]